MRQTKRGIIVEKGEGKDKKLLVISFLDDQTIELNSLEAPFNVHIFSIFHSESLCGCLVPQCPVKSCQHFSN